MLKVMKKQRFDQLEGLRGIAAIVVVLYHFLLAFYAFSFYGAASGSPQNMGLEGGLYGNPLMVFLSGSFAVALFFVLSGFVLSIGFFQSGKSEVIKKLAAKRYIRLMLPALASILLCFGIMALGISQLHSVAAISQSSWLLSTWNFTPNLIEAIQGGMFGIFLQEGNAYNNVLWTMMTEFMGSFIVFGFLALFGKLKTRWIFYCILLVATFNTWFLPFILGMIIADLYVHRSEIVARIQLKRYQTVVLVIVALALGGYPLGEVTGSVYGFITPQGAGAINWWMLYLTIGATILVATVMLSKGLTKFLSHRRVSILGKYTFSLYLTHLAVLYTFTMAIFMMLHWQVGLGFNLAVFIAVVSSIPVIAIVSILFEKYIDAPSIRFASYAGSVMLGERDIKLELRKVTRRWERVMRRFRKRQTFNLVVQEEIET
jgi:peptidoglycan/LPS O-acetylase OafA/YrhL